VAEKGGQNNRKTPTVAKAGKTSSCAPGTLGYVKGMDWQQIAALSVVAATAGVFMWTKLRPRKFSFEHDTHCGCAAPSPGGSRSSIVFSARKGERPRIILREN
jgi:hypothetical protein